MKIINKTRNYKDEYGEHKVKEQHYQIFAPLFWLFIIMAFLIGGFVFNSNKEKIKDINQTLQVTKTELNSCYSAKWAYQDDINECKETLKLQNAIIDSCYRRLEK